jgi:hypothetical protein
MKKETQELAQAIENLVLVILSKAQVGLTPPVPAEQETPQVQVVPTPARTAPVGPTTHDEVRALLLPIIQSDQNAMTAVHSVLTQQFKVNELTSLPVAQIPEFMQAVNAALEA